MSEKSKAIKRFMEEKVSKLEECDCTKSCQLPGGIIREDGASWSEGCQLCSCVVRPIILFTSRVISNNMIFELRFIEIVSSLS